LTIDKRYHTPAKTAKEKIMQGLDGIVAAETILSDVDGLNGKLIIRGHPVEELARHATAESVTQLLLSGFFADTPNGVDALVSAIGSARQEVSERLSAHLQDIASLPPIEALRAGLSLLPDGDDFPTALRLLAAPAVLTPALVRLRRGQPALAPDPDLSQSADMLRMLMGVPASEASRRALDAYLVTVSDHGLNASTFTARVVASTQAGLGSAAIAALSALKGPLHGGAPGPVLEMLMAIGQPENADAWLAGALARGERLMGFGHRIYKVRDPRADALKAAIEELSKAEARTSRLALAEAVEGAALRTLRREKPGRPLETNVEFYTAVLLDALGFPAESFTCVFATGRMPGWIAHAREQELTGRLMRPQSRYVGPATKEAA
jgi:citrate synthase